MFRHGHRVGASATASADQGLPGIGKRTLTESLLPAPGGGAKLPDPIRTKMERALGADFSDVRVHASSDEAAGMGAQALARGVEIFFAPGAYDPESSSGQELIGHELVHIIHQRGGQAKDPVDGVATDPALEGEADAAGAAAARGETARVAGAEGAGGAAAAAPGGAPAAGVAQARWVQGGSPLPKGGARWESVGDGNAPTGVYIQCSGIANRWTRQGTQDQYVYDPGTQHLDRADDYAIDMSGGAPDVVIDMDALMNPKPQSQPQPQPTATAVVSGGPASGGPSGGIRKQLPKVSDAERPDLSLVQSLASTLFSEEALKESDVRDLILRVLGDGFVQWAGSGIDDGALEKNVDQICLDKLAALQRRYADITLIDVIVISAYSWYADSYVRIEGQKQGWKDFGKWQTFAEQLIKSLRKLKRFTGDVLYRCSRPGHEAENLKSGGSWNASSFLSTTYSDEARKDLEQDPKYARGSTLHMDARNVEGYHMEEFSRFEREYEVVLLPGHKVQGQASASSQGRRIDATLVPPSYAQPRTGKEPDSVAEFEQLHKDKSKSVLPPPKMAPRVSSEQIEEIRSRADELYRAATAQYPLTEQTFETLRPAAGALAEFIQRNARHLEQGPLEEYRGFLTEVARRYAPSDQEAERELREQREAFAAAFLAEERGGIVVAADALAGAGLATEIERRANAYLWNLPTRELRDELRTWFGARYARGPGLPTDQPDTNDLRLAHYLAERQPIRAKFIELRQRHLAQRGGERPLVIHSPQLL